MARPKYIRGMVIPWDRLMSFLDTLPPWQSLMQESAGRVKDLDENYRHLAAMAVGTCLVHYRFPDTLFRVLDRIARNQPAPFRWHGQVPPDRWRDMNSYTVAMHAWLNRESPEAAAQEWQLPMETITKVYRYLQGERSPVKLAMVKRFLYQMVRMLVTTTNLSIVGDEENVPVRELRYQDYSRAWEVDGDEYQFLDPTDKPVRVLNEIIANSGPGGDAFLNYLERESTPICHLRSPRFQDLALYRIGSEWTEPGARPPELGNNHVQRQEFELYTGAVARWHDGRPAPDDRNRKADEQVQKITGPADERKRALVDCFFFRSASAADLQEAAYLWLQTNGHVPILEPAG